MTNAARLQEYWETTYECPTTHFDIEQPDEWIAAIEMRGGIRGEVLDAGCGPGRTALYLGGLGYSVLGVDLSPGAIARAQRKAAEQGSTAQFLQADLCSLDGHEGRFETVVDIGCFHSLHPDDRGRYAESLHRVCKPGSVIYLRAFSETNVRKENYPRDKCLPALREEEVRQAFGANGWAVWDLQEQEIPILVSGGRIVRAFCWFGELYYA